jgi:hypothetical protein
MNRTAVGLSRASTSWQHVSKKYVDGRDKPGHDEKENRFRLRLSLRGAKRRSNPFFGSEVWGSEVWIASLRSQ